MKFKVLSSIVYCIMENFFCVDCMCRAKKKLCVTCKGKGVENRTYNAVSGIVVPELLMNIISCRLFANNKKSAVILSCRSKLVDYYIQKNYVLLKNNSKVFNNVPLRVKEIINAENLSLNNFVMAC